MADLFKALKPKATLSKNGFDLSRKHVFSSKAGQCLPCLALETVPGDYHEIDVTAITRTRTMNTAAFMRGKMRYDFFFVPYSQLWHPFNQFITQRTDKHSTQQLGHIYAPVVSLGSILYQIIQEFNNDTKDVHDFSYAHGMVRILDLLGYGDFRWLFNVQDLSDSQSIEAVLYDYNDKYVNVFRLAAYQHIWYDYYRNKYFDTVESGGINAYDSDLLPNDYIYGFNFDDLNCSTFANSIIPGSEFVGGQPSNESIRLRMLLKMNYIQWKKDLFTSALPSQQFGAISTVDLNNVSIINNSVFTSTVNNVVGVGTDSNALNYKGLVVRTSSGGAQVGTNQTWSIPSAFDVLSLRKAEALQQWKQNTLRAGNMTDDSFKAHFGVEPYYDSDENVNYLGSVSAALQINSVETTAASSSDVNGQVGDLAATGTIVVKGNKVQFNARDYGVLMCISSFLPESEYSSNCIDKANTLHEQFDWFTPEFQNIGLEPVTAFQQNIGGFDDLDADFNHVLGYAPRYYMYKQAVDKVFGEFKETESSYISTESDSVQAAGSYAAWVSPRFEYVVGSNRDLATFYVSPSIYDNVFAVTADSSQNTDSFINNVYFDIKSIRPMSVLGLPQF